jgi:hypothetical protein
MCEASHRDAELAREGDDGLVRRMWVEGTQRQGDTIPRAADVGTRRTPAPPSGRPAQGGPAQSRAADDLSYHEAEELRGKLDETRAWWRAAPGQP